MVPADLVPGQSSFSGLQNRGLLDVSSHGGERENNSLISLLIRALVHKDLLLGLITSQRSHLNISSHWGFQC